MVNFGLSLGFSSGLMFGSTPQRPEWESISLIFGSHVYFPFYKDLSNQLQEVIDGKRQEFAFDEEQDYAEFVPGEAIRIKLSVYDNVHVNDTYVEVEDFDTDKKVYVKAQDLKIIVDNWIKFIDVNTKAFSEK